MIISDNLDLQNFGSLCPHVLIVDPILDKLLPPTHSFELPTCSRSQNQSTVSDMRMLVIIADIDKRADEETVNSSAC